MKQPNVITSFYVFKLSWIDINVMLPFAFYSMNTEQCRASKMEWKTWGSGSHWGLILSKGTQAVKLCPYHSAEGSSAPKEGIRGFGWGGRPREKALVPGQLMRAGLLTEGPQLEEDAIVCGSSTPQRSHFLWLMFHSELPALPGTSLSIHHISDNAAELITSMCCRMYGLQSISIYLSRVAIFFLSVWEYASISACASPVYFPCCPLCVFYLHEWVL